MYVRLTSFSIPVEKQEEVKSMYYSDIAPIIKEQPGLVDVMLLEPIQGQEEFISCTIWQSEDDTRKFESSPAYPSVFGKVKSAALAAPTQKYFTLK